MPEAERPGAHRPNLGGALGEGVICPVVLAPDPVLRKISQPAGYLDGYTLIELAANLFATMYALGGRSLAAPQIGVLRRIFVMDESWQTSGADPKVLLDPEIIRLSDDRITAPEASLSEPELTIGVSRAVEVELVWFDLQGTRQQRVLRGDAAILAQQGVDYLHGRLLLDFL